MVKVDLSFSSDSIAVILSTAIDGATVYEKSGANGNAIQIKESHNNNQDEPSIMVLGFVSLVRRTYSSIYETHLSLESLPFSSLSMLFSALPLSKGSIAATWAASIVPLFLGP